MRRAIPGILLMLYAFSMNAAAQTKLNNYKQVRISFACNFFDNSTSYSPPPASSISDEQAEAWMRGMISRICSVTGLQNRFFLKAMKNYNNCSAVCFSNDIGEDRYIQFDRDFLEKYQDITKDKWFVLGAVAHEIGHHLNGHSQDGVASRPEKELEADEFAGYVLQKLGASLTDAQNVFSFLNETQGPPTHPVRAKRYAAIKRGWDKAAGIVSYETLSFNEADIKNFALRNLTLARSSTNLNDRLSYINAALRNVPNYAEALSEKGLVFLEKKMFDSAYYYTNKALRAEPEIGWLHLNKAKVFYYDQKADQSAEELELALKWKPIFPEAYLFKAQVGFEKKDYAEALKQNEMALAMAPQTNQLLADVVSGIAIAKYNLGQFGEAYEYMQAAKEIDPENFRAKVLLDDYKKKAGR